MAKAIEQRKQKKPLTSNLVAYRWLCSSGRRLVFYRQTFYERKPSYWKLIERDAVAHTIHEDAKNQHGLSQTARMVNEAVDYVQNECFVAGEREPPFWLDGRNDPRHLIACRNGLLDATTRQLIPHDPQFFNTAAVDFDYDPSASCPKWLAFINWFACGDVALVGLLQEWVAYCLLPQLQYQKLLWLMGGGANGKSVFCEVMRRLIGPGNCSAVPLERFQNQFGLVSMLGKVLNVVSDVEEVDRVAEGVLKMLASGDALSVDRKFKSALEAIRLPIRLLFSSNPLPYFRDRSWGLWRRLMLVECKARVEEGQQIANYEDQFNDELPGILNWALDATARLIANGRFQIPESVAVTVSSARDDANPAATFLKEYCVQDQDCAISGRELFAAYQIYCERWGHSKSMAWPSFAKQIHAVFPTIRRARKTREVLTGYEFHHGKQKHIVNGARESVYLGIRFQKPPTKEEQESLDPVPFGPPLPPAPSPTKKKMEQHPKAIAQTPPNKWRQQEQEGDGLSPGGTKL